MKHVPTKGPDGLPWCPVCEQPVDQEGTFDTRACYTHFIVAVTQQPGMVEMEKLLDMHEMPWYGE